jgi:molybdopterin molybdotransferase
MITPAQAQAIIMSKSLQLATVAVSINDAMNRVLAEDLYADSDLPPFDRVMMDGIAVRFESLQREPCTFAIAGINASRKIVSGKLFRRQIARIPPKTSIRKTLIGWANRIQT